MEVATWLANAATCSKAELISILRRGAAQIKDKRYVVGNSQNR
jgi:hypothetical protein